MRFNRHLGLEGTHAFMAPSQPAWLRYDDDKIVRSYSTRLAAIRGTEEHEFAQMAIRLGHRLPDIQKTMNMYVNDSIGWRLKPEVTLFWTKDCFGTADAIDYKVSERVLRISDLKTGRARVKFDQLVVYAALFCLEYEIKPMEMESVELRIYQNNDVELYLPSSDEIFRAMDRILVGTRIIEEMRQEALS